jgi:hypothetical protein
MWLESRSPSAPKWRGTSSSDSSKDIRRVVMGDTTLGDATGMGASSERE